MTAELLSISQEEKLVKPNDAYEYGSLTEPDNAAVQVHVEAPVLPGLSDRYTIIQALGSGAQGSVFLAERIADKKRVAIKQLLIDSIKTWKEYTLFHREAATLANLDIPGVVKFYEACDCLDVVPPCSYIVQEYVEGTTLKDMLVSGHRFSLTEVYELTLQLLDILEKLHTHVPPIIHRDIKPTNIIRRTTEHGGYTVCLIDFGAVANPQVQSGGSTVAGTYGYMAPEQTIGRAEPQSDIYSLGALVAYMLSGVEPAEMKTQNLRLIIDPYLENHPVALVQTLRRMLEPTIQDRLTDYKELKLRFNNFKKNIYALENETHEPFSKSVLKKRLENVKYICQPQNLEIWQNLPDLPQNRSKLPFRIKTRPRFCRYPVCVNELKCKDEENGFFIAINAICFVTLFACSFFVFDPETYEPNNPNFIPTMAFTGGAILALIFSGSFCHGSIKAPAGWLRTHWEQAPINHGNRVKPARCKKHELIYRTGRKTIATITSIQFVSAIRDISHSESLDNIERIEKRPCFKVRYKFNPPDDDLQEDIMHTMIIHREPDGIFKVGDPLPILYICQVDASRHVLHVTESMPYPLPLQDLEKPEDYIGHIEPDNAES
ncbi:MAG: serine/threonine protein kinase [Proteobacteria bacterium]|nr:serine/threonine protein kinase [Pseudomonadota bacterium]